MFTAIFRFELRYWFRQPTTYIYAAVFLLLSLVSMWGLALDEGTHSEKWLNAPVELIAMAGFFHKLILFLFPAIIGLSVYRDFSSKVYALLFAYPIRKRHYWPAKFASSLLVMALITATIVVGLYLGTLMPGVQQERMGPFRLMAYLQAYFVYFFPSLLLFGAVVFGVVAFTRNIYAGFVTVVLLFFLQGLAGSLLGGLDNRFWAAVFDPFGQKAIELTTQYWTIAERNERLIPLGGVIAYNRLLWLGLAGLLSVLAYRQFSLDYAAPALPFKKKKAEPLIENNFGSIAKITLSPSRFDFSLAQQLRACWRLSNVELRYILTSRLFLVLLGAGLLLIFFQQTEMNPEYGLKTLPVTWKMLRAPALIFIGAINILTFLYAGMLVQRARLAGANQLVDVTPTPNWVFLLSKFAALVKMQALLLSLILIGGIAVQAISGYYQFEIGHYLLELYGLHWPALIIWAFVAIFIQTLFTNPYLGFFLLILGSMGMNGLPEFGIEPYVFRYNTGPGFVYSALDGYGATLLPYFTYKIYWSLFGLFLLLGAWCWWTRGLPDSFRHRFRTALSRLQKKAALPMALLLLSFLTMGGWIYRAEYPADGKVHSEKEEELWMVAYEQRYKRYEHCVQPKIKAVALEADIYPEARRFEARGNYLLVNESEADIDTLLVNYSYKGRTSYHFQKPARHISRDSVHCLSLLVLEEPLAPGDSLQMYFEVESEPHTLFQPNQRIRSNGTFFFDDAFPGLGYAGLELTDNAKRRQYGLPEKDSTKPYPSDSSALYNNYGSMDSDWIHFEATVSTSGDQVALAPGYLQREWRAGGRRYFHYKMDSPIKDFYGFNSGRYEVLKDQWEGIDLEIYYHKGHTYNLDRMMRGLKGALAYNSQHFSPYQHRQARIIEFSMANGTFATTFANSIPFTEKHFIVDVDDSREGSIDFPFYVAAHEMAHQWWGNQLLPADVLGAKMLTESMAEYTALKVLEKEYGREKLRRFLKMDLDLYLAGRATESQREMPLMYARHQQDYINYRKGALVFYALSDYLGEEKLNTAIRSYLETVQFQSAPYTTSLEMVAHIRAATPDSLQYLIEDLFETVTLYDNHIEAVDVKPLSGGQYQVDIEFVVRKYRAGENGERIYTHPGITSEQASLPLADYIELGVFGKDGGELYLRKHKVTGVRNRLRLLADEPPGKIAVDPYHKLIDANVEDNWR